MRCHIIVSLKSFECVESHSWPDKKRWLKIV